MTDAAYWIVMGGFASMIGVLSLCGVLMVYRRQKELADIEAERRAADVPMRPAD